MFVYKVTKHQMRLSIRQKRQAHNRNCATAAGEHTVVSHLFEGQLSYMTLCMHCDHQAHSTQTFTVLSLPIPANAMKCSIQVTSNSCWSLQFPCHISDTSHHPPFIIPCFLTILFLCCAGLLVPVLRADYPDWGRADAVFGVWAEERNNSHHLFGQTSRDPRIAPETVGRNVTSAVGVTFCK